MVDKEKIKNYLFNEVPKVNLVEEIETKIGYDLIMAVNAYANAMSEHIKNVGTPIVDKIAGAMLLGCLLRDYVLIDDQRDRLEVMFDAVEIKKPQFMSYDEFVKRFEKTDCFKIDEELGIKNPINCAGFKCMSLQCYCAYKDAYYGE